VSICVTFWCPVSSGYRVHTLRCYYRICFRAVIVIRKENKKMGRFSLCERCILYTRPRSTSYVSCTNDWLNGGGGGAGLQAVHCFIATEVVNAFALLWLFTIAPPPAQPARMYRNDTVSTAGAPLGHIGKQCNYTRDCCCRPRR